MSVVSRQSSVAQLASSIFLSVCFSVCLLLFFCRLSPHGKTFCAMHIAELTAYVVRVPLRREIQHASASRQESTNLVVCCRLDNGITGWGEGVPRHYVTGETPEGALQQFAATEVTDQLQNACGHWLDVIRLCESFQPSTDRRDPRGAYGNALRCAVELSMLDAYGRHFGEPLSSVAQHFPAAQDFIRDPVSVRYSTTITAETARRERISALKMRLYGFHQCKVKVGVAGADDAQRLRCIRFWLGRRMDIRLDANEAWRAVELPGRLSAAAAIPHQLHRAAPAAWGTRGVGAASTSTRRTRDAG